MFDHFCSGAKVLDPVEELTVAPSSSEEPAGLALHQLAVRDCVLALEKEGCTMCWVEPTCCNMLQLSSQNVPQCQIVSICFRSLV